MTKRLYVYVIEKEKEVFYRTSTSKGSTKSLDLFSSVLLPNDIGYLSGRKDKSSVEIVVSELPPIRVNPLKKGQGMRTLNDSERQRLESFLVNKRIDKPYVLI